MNNQETLATMVKQDTERQQWSHKTQNDNNGHTRHRKKTNKRNNATQKSNTNPIKTGMNLGAREGLVVPAPYKTPAKFFI